MQHHSLIRRINDFLASAPSFDKPNGASSFMAEQILEEFRSDEDFNRRIVAVAGRFSAEGLDATACLKAAVKQPALFGLSPKTIEANIRGLVARFSAEGLDAAAYLKTALKHPPLFYQSPDKMAQHITIIRDIYASGCCQPLQGSIWKFLCSRPIILTLSSANLHLREHLALHQGLTGAKALSMGTLFGKELHKLREVARRVVPEKHPTWLLMEKESHKR
jgi:hypothetical protein